VVVVVGRFENEDEEELEDMTAGDRLLEEDELLTEDELLDEEVLVVVVVAVVVYWTVDEDLKEEDVTEESAELLDRLIDWGWELEVDVRVLSALDEIANGVDVAGGVLMLLLELARLDEECWPEVELVAVAEEEDVTAEFGDGTADEVSRLPARLLLLGAIAKLLDVGIWASLAAS
jgi:hypothetical protein